MTEDEAKTKMCCGPPAVAASAYYRAGADTDAPFHCIASACMAWRKIPHASQFKDARTGKLSDRDMTGHGTWIESGFCGLAGAPQ